MKKLALACCAILVVGGCMMLGGWAAGGRLYGSYYNGVLHPVTESLRDLTYGIQSRWHYYTWKNEHGWHSGWFEDHPGDWIGDTVDDVVDDALDVFDPDWWFD
ncbi:MAG TPA: hypothetical protein H9845_07740 [Candidatus Agathobaculum pullicola]|nr:hypothetical protein [Candidatus Agathobaculum pullicola]